MKEYMSYSANDKMVDHKIFWDNVWNWIALALAGGSIIGLISICKELTIWF